jgi:hypothetical protein
MGTMKDKVIDSISEFKLDIAGEVEDVKAHVSKYKVVQYMFVGFGVMVFLAVLYNALS